MECLQAEGTRRATSTPLGDDFNPAIPEDDLLKYVILHLANVPLLFLMEQLIN